MKGSVRIGTLRGVPVRVHWSFPLLFVLIAAASAGRGGAAAVEATVWIAAIFASVVIHELAHARVAMRRGLRVLDIVLLPIGGVSEIPGMDRTADDELAVAVAGPATSLGLAAALAVVALATGEHLWPPTMFVGGWAARLAWANLVLGLFNLLPAFPLDGGRVLRALLERTRDRPTATATAVRIGRILAVAMIVAGLFVDLWLAVIGVFVLMAGTAEARGELLRVALDGRTVADLARPPGPDLGAPDDGDLGDLETPILDPSTPLYPDGVQRLAESGRPAVLVGSTARITGVLYAADVQAALVAAAGGTGRPRPGGPDGVPLRWREGRSARE